MAVPSTAGKLGPNVTGHATYFNCVVEASFGQIAADTEPWETMQSFGKLADRRKYSLELAVFRSEPDTGD
jgi:hypothetical protein